MFNTKKAMLVLATFAVIGSVDAAPVSLGNLGLHSTATATVNVPDDGPFSNEFTFSLTAGNAVQIGLTSSFWGGDVPALSFELSGGAGAGIYTPDVFVDADFFGAGLMLTGLHVGDAYSLIISGTFAENLGESYSVQIAPNMVSEPDSMSLLLASLGLMGLLANRRKNIEKEVL